VCRVGASPPKPKLERFNQDDSGNQVSKAFDLALLPWNLREHRSAMIFADSIVECDVANVVNRFDSRVMQALFLLLGLRDFRIQSQSQFRYARFHFFTF
jgi:hypothetical protein